MEQSGKRRRGREVCSCGTMYFGSKWCGNRWCGRPRRRRRSCVGLFTVHSYTVCEYHSYTVSEYGTGVYEWADIINQINSNVDLLRRPHCRQKSQFSQVDRNRQRDISAVPVSGRSLSTQIHYGFQIVVTFALELEDKDRNKVKQKLLETSRVLYLFIICSTSPDSQRWYRSTLPSTTALTPPFLAGSPS